MQHVLIKLINESLSVESGKKVSEFARADEPLSHLQHRCPLSNCAVQEPKPDLSGVTSVNVVEIAV